MGGMTNHKENPERNAITRLRPHFEFKAIEMVGERVLRWGWPVIFPLTVIWWDKAHHIDRDWIGIALLLVVGFIVGFMGVIVDRRREKRRDEKFAEWCVKRHLTIRVP